MAEWDDGREERDGVPIPRQRDQSHASPLCLEIELTSEPFTHLQLELSRDIDGEPDMCLTKCEPYRMDDDDIFQVVVHLAGEIAL